MKPVELLLTAPIRSSSADALGQAYRVHHLWEHADRQAFLDAVGPRIRGVATSTLFGRVDAELLDKLPAAEIVASFGVGYDNVDVLAAVERGIVVTNTSGVLDDEVADLSVGLLIATLRRIPQADRFVREGQWTKGAFPLSPTLRGRRVGLVGFGNIGQAIARRLAAFDVALAYHSRRPRAESALHYHPTVVGLARASDVLIAIVPGGPSTRHLIDREVLAALGPEGVLINVSRGSVVDEQALIEALQSGTILAAGLDVYEDEPRVPRALIAMEQVVLLPHIGSASEPTRSAMGQLVVDNLLSWFERGRAITPVPETRHLQERSPA